MQKFTTEELRGAFQRSGTVKLRIKGASVAVEYSTKRYEEARRAFLAEVPYPRRKPVRTELVGADTPLGRQLQLSTAALFEVYSPATTADDAAVNAYHAELGRYLAAYCLEIELTDSATGGALDERGRLDFYRGAMADQAANDVTVKLRQSVTLEVADLVDFSGPPSAPGGGEGTAPPEE